MPHIEIKYSKDLKLDCKLIFNRLESVINTFDSTSGVCKARAYPCSIYSHTHVLVEVMIMRKSHRHQQFCEELLEIIHHELSKILTGKYYFSLSLGFSSEFYITKKIE